MSDKKKSAPVVQPIPDNLPEELLPLYDWWKANGTKTIITIGAILVLTAGFYAIRGYREAKITKANQELLHARTIEDLEAAVVSSKGTKAGNAIRLRLAKAYYDAGRFEDALNTYNDCLSKKVPDGFKEIAELGKAFSLEGLKKLPEAKSAYQAFETAYPDHFLTAEATMGVARILTLEGKKDEAKKILEKLKALKTGDSRSVMKITRMETLVTRYQPRAERSLFEAADEAAKKPASSLIKVPAPAKEAISTVPAKPKSVVKAPAPAAKPAVKAPAPAAKPAVKAPAPAAKPAVKTPAPAAKPAAKAPAAK